MCVKFIKENNLIGHRTCIGDNVSHFYGQIAEAKFKAFTAQVATTISTSSMLDLDRWRQNENHKKGEMMDNEMEVPFCFQTRKYR